MMKDRFDKLNQGWLLIDENYLYDDATWNALGGIFFPKKQRNGKNVSFKMGRTCYILGKSEWFSDYKGDGFDAPKYSAIINGDDELYGFQMIEEPIKI